MTLLKAGTWSADLAVARADVDQAAAVVRQDQMSEPLMILGAGKGLHVRADVDENDAWRVRPDTLAVARLRGNSRLSFPLEFLRFEPYVIPKKSLTGDVSERIDTRTLQVIYRFKDADPAVFNGQQLDIFIDTPVGINRETSMGTK